MTSDGLGWQSSRRSLLRTRIRRQLPFISLTSLPHLALISPQVVLAASNPYDANYLRRALGVTPVPWPGTARQLLETVSYTGEHREPLLCCGNSAYNHAIGHIASAILNASRASSAPNTAPSLAGGPPLIDFRWPSEVGSGGHRGYK